MSSWSFVQFTAMNLGRENKFSSDEKWLVDEIIYLLDKYPELEQYINKKKGSLSLSDILLAFFEVIRLRKKINKIDNHANLKNYDYDDLYKIRLSDYFLAGFSIFLALKYCFNHRYNKDEYIYWNIDYTEAYKAVLKTINQKNTGINEPPISGGSNNPFKPR